jgi:hypothetical protein
VVGIIRDDAGPINKRLKYIVIWVERYAVLHCFVPILVQLVCLRMHLACA